MPVHTDIKVLPLDSETCEVIAVEGLLATRHRVAVPPAQLELIHLCDRDMAAVVHETFVMALERELPTARITQLWCSFRSSEDPLALRTSS